MADHRHRRFERLCCSTLTRTVPVNDKICNREVARVQGANVIQLIFNGQRHVVSFGGIKRHKHNVCFVRLVRRFDGGQLNADWLFKVSQQILQLQ